MDAFYLIISTISILFLILILSFFGMLMRTHNKGAPFPPNASTCPDYWNVNEDGTCSATIKSEKNNVKTYFNIGSLYMPFTKQDSAPYATGTTFDPQDIKWSSTGKSVLCAQRDWANQNGIEWSGISNYNNC